MKNIFFQGIPRSLSDTNRKWAVVFSKPTLDLLTHKSLVFAFHCHREQDLCYHKVALHFIKPISTFKNRLSFSHKSTFYYKILDYLFHSFFLTKECHTSHLLMKQRFLFHTQNSERHLSLVQSFLSDSPRSAFTKMRAETNGPQEQKPASEHT